MRKAFGRNDPCPCGSGRKYKKCCLANEAVATAADTTTRSQGKYRFEPGSYGDEGRYLPSIACLASTQGGGWKYHFVLVRPDQVIAEEEQATLRAGEDLAEAFAVKARGGSDAELAMALRSKGYLSVDNFHIVGRSKYQA